MAEILTNSIVPFILTLFTKNDYRYCTYAELHEVTALHVRTYSTTLHVSTAFSLLRDFGALMDMSDRF